MLATFGRNSLGVYSACFKMTEWDGNKLLDISMIDIPDPGKAKNDITVDFAVTLYVPTTFGNNILAMRISQFGST